MDVGEVVGVDVGIHRPPQVIVCEQSDWLGQSFAPTIQGTTGEDVGVAMH